MKALNRRMFLSSVAATCLFVGRKADARFPHGDTVHGWQTLKLGAGGQLSGIDIAADGTTVVRADTYGCYYWNAALSSGANDSSTGRWVQMVTSLTMPSPTVPNQAYNLPYSCFEIRIAPTNTNRFYMYLSDGNIYTTTNRGVNWTKCATLTGGPFFPDGANPDSKFYGPYMAVDPQNELICFVSSPANGVFKTINGGTSWNAISTANVPSGNSPGSNGDGVINTGNQIAFDPSSSVSGGATQGVYINSWGHGVYHSTDGGASWSSALAGQPAQAVKLACDTAGKIYLAGDGTPNIYVYDGTWHTYSTGTQECRSFAIDPANISHVAAVTTAGMISTTTAGVASGWTGYTTSPNNHRTASDIPWLGNIPDASMTASVIAYGPSSVLYLAAGIGVWKQPNPISGPGVMLTWTSQSVGIEQLVADWAVSPPGGNPVLAFFDRPIFTITDRAKYPTQYGPSYTGSVFEGYSCDWASSSPSTIVALVSGPGNGGSGPNLLAVSSNGGGADGGPSNWTYPAGAMIGNNGGCVAASTALNFVAATQAGGLIYTLNGGATSWLASTTGIATPDPDNGFGGFSASHKRQPVCADRVLANTFYSYNGGTTQPGFYVSTDGGVNFVYKASAGGIMGASSLVNPQLRSVPGVSGNFYANPCAGITPGTGNGFYEMQWNGTTLTKTAVPGVTDVWGHGCGKAKPGNAYPSVGIYGTVTAARDVAGIGGRGFWQSDDHCVSWTQLSDGFPNHLIDEVVTVEGDNNTYGIFYVGFNGSGFAYYQP